MQIVRVNDCDFKCQVTGQGPDMVFIHGEIHGLDYWEHQIADFSRDHRCLIYNRRGHDGSELTPYGYSVAHQTRDLMHLLDHFGMKRPTVVSLAFGTTIAANFTVQYPERVQALVMVAWGELYEAMLYFSRWEEYGKRAADILDQQGRDALIDMLMKEGGKTIFRVIPGDASPVREKAVRLLASHPAEEYRRCMLEVASSVPVLLPLLKQLDVPVLGLSGADDPFPNDPSQLAGMKSFYEAPPIPGGGRFVNWEQPAAFNAAIRQFLHRAKAGSTLRNVG